MKTLASSLVLLLVAVTVFAAEPFSRKFIDNLEYIGVVLDRPGYYTWGTSVVKGDDNKYHMYACQWPVKFGFANWNTESMVNYFVADKPEGPYKFVKTIVGPRPGGDQEGVWNRFTAHNPEVKRIDGYYVLVYISYPKRKNIPNGSIGMKIAKNPAGPWKDVGTNGLIKQKSKVKGFPSYRSGRGTDNPSLVKYKNKYYLFFMYNRLNTSLGVAVSDSLFGPYKEQKIPALLPGKGKRLEDVCAFITEDGNIGAVMCDNWGIHVYNGGIYAEMDKDHFEKTGEVTMKIKSIAWDTRNRMFPDQDFSKGKHVYGPNKFERPKILTIDGRPSYMFAPSGFNAKGDPWTVLHGFRIKHD